MVTRPQVHVFLSVYLSFYALIIMGHHRAMFRALEQPEAGLEKPSTEQQLSSNSFAVVAGIGEGGVFSKHSKFQGMVKNFSCSNITCSHWIGWQGMCSTYPVNYTRYMAVISTISNLCRWITSAIVLRQWTLYSICLVM